MLAEHELADLYLAERLTAPELRRRLTAGMPNGYGLVDLHDVWIGAPAIAPQLAAADYRLTLLHVEPSTLESATARLMSADQLPRQRRKETRNIPYDLRPLVIDLKVALPEPTALPPDIDPREAAGLWMRLRHSQDSGSGRAEEVVAALADEMGLAVGAGAESGHAEAPAFPPEASAVSPATPEISRPASAATDSRPALEVVRPVRERLWLADELLSPEPASPGRAP